MIDLPLSASVEKYHRNRSTNLNPGDDRSAWSGGFLQREERAHDDLRNALVREIRRLTAGLSQEPLPESDTVSLTRAKVEPMVRGLFPKVEQDLVLAMLERSVNLRGRRKHRVAPARVLLRWLCVDARERVRRKPWRGAAWEDRATDGDDLHLGFVNSSPSGRIYRSPVRHDAARRPEIRPAQGARSCSPCDESLAGRRELGRPSLSIDRSIGLQAC